MKKVFSLMSFRTCFGISIVLTLALLISALFIPLTIYADINDDLRRAAEKGDINKVKSLLQHGADVNAKDNNGNTALMYAAVGGHTEIVQTLLNKGANVNAKNNFGNTALIYAVKNGRTEIVSLLGYAMEGKYIAQQKTPPPQKAPPVIDIVSLTFSEPSGNNILDAEEKGTIFIKAKNTGKGTAFDVHIRLIPNESVKGMSFAKETSIGNINPNEEKTVSIDISADEALLTKDVSLKATLIESGGFDSQPVILSFKTSQLIPPVLQLAKLNIEDSEGRRVITKGKETNITLTVQNAGMGIARGVVVTIESGDPNVKVFGDNKVVLGILNPGESKKAVFSIAVTQRYSGAETLPVSFSIDEERKRFSLRPDIKLALNKEAPEIKVVKVEAKETPLFTPVASEGIDAVQVLNTAEQVVSPMDIAVVIGIEQYKNVPKSDYSYDDAKLMKAYLKALGFAERNIQFVTNTDATKSGIEKSIEGWLKNKAKPESRVFVYYSGHGAPEPKTGDAYLVPYDGDPNYLELTGYPLKRLYDNLGKLQVAEVVVVLDSCFSGSGGRSVLAKGARPLVMTVEGLILPQNMAVLTSTQGTDISTSNPERGHGVFTYYFLKALKEGKKSLAEIYEYIKPLVENEAKELNVQQSPSISPEIEKLRGRFNLRK
ncbi:MAG: ankyrin repeat domain-containing protein [Nitrospirae bacterium]|nr:ankyrin repeat domain-containing protein [Nitrospirota bacterium]